MISFNRILLTLVLAASFLGCHQDRQIMDARKLREIVAAQLHPGDSAETIKKFYAEHDIQYFYDEHFKRYSAGYPLPKAELDRGHTLQVDIYVDKDGAFLRADIGDSYTGL